MSDPNPRQVRQPSSSSDGGVECTGSRARGGESPVVNVPRPSAAPAGSLAAREATRDRILTLCAVEERLDAARRENDNLKNRNRQLARALAAARQRGSEARHLAHHDTLTGLPNRLLLMERLQEGISTAARRGRKLVLLFIDLDHFKRVNDRLGHAAGDELLVIVASRILGGLRAEDIAFRYGGDEFVVIMSDIGDGEIVDTIADKIRQRIDGRYGIDDREVNISASIGVAVYPANGDHCDALIRHADASMYHCKAVRAVHAETGSTTVVGDHAGNRANPAAEAAPETAGLPRDDRVSAACST